MADPRYLFEPLLFQAITPIHVGSGQDVGLVDLPVIRERTTGHPFLPGSGIRGALRDRCEDRERSEGKTDMPLTRRLFGSEGSDEISAGCLSFLDAHLLLFPVRSVPGPFVWITCPFLIERYRRLVRELTGGETSLVAPSAPPAEGTYLGGDDQTYLEEYAFSKGTATWIWNGHLDGIEAARVLLLGDTDFLHFARHATIVRQRNRLSTAKTVLKGNLFSVEMVPAESWFFGFAGATEERLRVREDETEEKKRELTPPPPMDNKTVSRKLRELLTGSETGNETHVILGGDESVGLGITRLLWKEAAK
jgi:CRISPR-associated protein Cmr4